MLFDSHAHLNNEDNTPEMLAELIETIERSSLDYVMDIGFDLDSSIRAAQHGRQKIRKLWRKRKTWVVQNGRANFSPGSGGMRTS